MLEKGKTVLFLICLSSSEMCSYHLLQRDHIKGRASALTIPVSCTGIIKPLPLPSPEMTSTPPLFSPRLSSTSEDHSGLFISIIHHAGRHPVTRTGLKPKQEQTCRYNARTGLAHSLYFNLIYWCKCKCTLLPLLLVWSAALFSVKSVCRFQVCSVEHQHCLRPPPPSVLH